MRGMLARVLSPRSVRPLVWIMTTAREWCAAFYAIIAIVP